MNLFFKTALLIGFITSCNNNSVRNNYFDKICTDSSVFKVDSAKGTLSRYTIETNKYLNLRRITTPSDTFFLRVEYNVDTVDRIFEYSYYDSKESFKLYSFPMDHDTPHEILFDKEKDDATKFVRVFDPAKKGKEFKLQLEKNDILNLPSCFILPGYPDYIEAYKKDIIVEYSYKCKYGIYAYTNVHDNAEKFKEAKSLVNFLDYLKHEFDF